MHGFFGVYGSNEADFYDLSSLDSSLIKKEVSVQQLRLTVGTQSKFSEDKLFVDTDSYFYATEGVIFNISELLYRFKKKNFVELVPYLFEKFGKTFFSHFRGSFCGVFYDKRSEECIVFNDHIGDKMLFYATTTEHTYFSSDFSLLTALLRKKGEIKLCESFMYSMLVYGYSPIEETLISGVVRIPAGCYLLLSSSNIELVSYHSFTNKPNAFSIDENIEELDRLFKQAVSRITDKNAQYGYKNYMPLSAGLDSRMTVWVAKQLTSAEIINVTYSQSGFYDEITSKEIAAYVGNKLYFKSLDDGEYLKTLDSIVAKTEGLINYGGAAQVLDSFQDLPTSEIGVIGTGMLGDIVIKTTFTKKDQNQPYSIGDGAISTKNHQLLTPHLPANFLSKYANRELYYLYVRGFNCVNLGSPLILQHISESFSPFYDVDFLEFICSIPLEQRWDYTIYDAWILSKYPEVAKWLHNGVRSVGEKKRIVSVMGRAIPLKDIPKRILMYLIKKIGLYNSEAAQMGKSMNPIDSWIKENSSLRSFLEEYYDQHIHLLNGYPIIQTVAKKQFRIGVGMEKLQVLTLLSAIKQFPLGQ